MPRVLNLRTCGCPPPAGSVLVDRSTPWGNPYRLGAYGRAECLRLFAGHVRRSSALRRRLDELKGRDLVCHCAPLDCHAQLWLWLANADEATRAAWYGG